MFTSSRCRLDQTAFSALPASYVSMRLVSCNQQGLAHDPPLHAARLARLVVGEAIAACNELPDPVGEGDEDGPAAAARPGLDFSGLTSFDEEDDRGFGDR